MLKFAIFIFNSATLKVCIALASFGIALPEIGIAMFGFGIAILKFGSAMLKADIEILKANIAMLKTGIVLPEREFGEFVPKLKILVDESDFSV